jgi:hypothetical protein
MLELTVFESVVFLVKFCKLSKIGVAQMRHSGLVSSTPNKSSSFLRSISAYKRLKFKRFSV